MNIETGPRNLITDVAGLEVGNAEDADVQTGVSVVLARDGAVAAVDVRGGGPGTRETDALDPVGLVDKAHAVVLAGGSVYGLDAASGVAAWLGARDIGFSIAPDAPVAPIVPAAILFDLTNGGNKAWGERPPYHDLGLAACSSVAAEFPLGTVGAGYGARAGQLKGGLGSASARTSRGLTVGALVAANPFGSVVDPSGQAFWAGHLERESELDGRGSTAPPPVGPVLAGTKADALAAGGNTTIGVVATDAVLATAEAQRVAIMAQDGYARAIRPVHTPFDGDTVFALATGREPISEEMRPLLVTEIGALAADCLARAVMRAVYEATTLGNMTALRDLA